MRDTTNPERTPSGRFLVRMTPRLHAALREAAAGADLSLNEYCVRRLEGPDWSVQAGAAQTVGRAAHIVGAGLVGVLVFGSWARGEASAKSDVDVLVVVEDGFDLDRVLYREWDASPVRWGSRRVEAHFAHLPDRGGAVSGLWAEAAVDGIVLFERGLMVSRWLIEVRRRIAEGLLVRRWSHGQPYWVEAA